MKNRYFLTAIRLILFFSVLFFAEPAAGQNRTRIAFIDVLRKMETCKDSVCTIKDVDISLKTYVEIDTAIIKSEIILENCVFLSEGIERTYGMERLNFKKPLVFHNCKIERGIVFENSTFERGIHFFYTDINFLFISNCILSHFFIYNINANIISINQCKLIGESECYSTLHSMSFHTRFRISNDIVLDKKILQLQISNINISINPDIGEKKDRYGDFFVSGVYNDCYLEGIKLEAFYRSNNFKEDKSSKINIDVSFNNVRTDNFKIKNCDWGNRGVQFSNCAITGSFALQNNIFKDKILIDDVLFPDKTNIAWNQIGGGRISSELFLSKHKQLPAQLNAEHFADSYIYNEFIATYARLLEIYRRRGDNESATGCYVEMKDLQSRHQEYLYQKEPTLKNYFDWKIQVFLKFFCDYGSDPVKSLLYSVYLMGLFSILYFIFPSETDNLQRSRWIPLFRRAMRYFQTNVPIDAPIARDFKSLRELVSLKRALVGTAGEFPGALRTYGLLLYRLHLARFAARRWAYRWVDLSRQPYATLPVWQRRRVALGTALFLTGFLGWGLFQRILHAAALSMNAFVTLGYGEIEARGVARYLAVIEGVCGWFLLSIFSVSLINNVMQ